MKTFSLAVVLTAGLALAVPPMSASAQHSHGEASQAINYGKLAIGEFALEVTGAPMIAGQDGFVDVMFKAMPVPMKAVRMWVGSENASETGKTKLQVVDGKSVHAHFPVPSPLTADHKIWIEVEAGGKKERGSLPIPAAAGIATAPGAHNHGNHVHAFEAAVAARGEGLFAVTLMADGKQLVPTDFQPENKTLLRLFVVDESLTDVRVVVPTVGENGVGEFPFAAKQPGPYRVYARAWKAGEERAETVLASLPNPGEAAAADLKPNTEFTAEGVRFQLKWNPAPKIAHEGKFSVTATSADGTPIPLSDTTLVSLGVNPEHTRVIAPVEAEGAVSGAVKHSATGLRRLFVHTEHQGRPIVAQFTYAIEPDAHGHAH
jgi:hypothetical protein